MPLINPSSSLNLKGFASNFSLSLGQVSYFFGIVSTGTSSDTFFTEVVATSLDELIKLIIPTLPTDQQNNIDAIWSAVNVIKTSALFTAEYSNPLNWLSFSLAVNSYFLGSVLRPAVDLFAHDPPDPDFLTVYQPSIPTPPTLPSTGNAQLDALLNQQTLAIERASAYLQAVNASFDKYAGAIAAGDSIHATLQMEAMLQYLYLYDQAAQDSAAAIQSTENLLASLGLATSTYDPQQLVSLQNQIAADGLPANMVSLLNQVGLSSTQIDQVKQHILNLNPDGYSGTLTDANNAAASTLLQGSTAKADTMTGSLQVAITPPEAVSAGAKWQVDSDGNWHNSGDTVADLLMGAHTVSYTNLTGWIKPADQSVAVGFNETTLTNGIYELTPVLLAAVSRKVHGSAGTFDLNLNLNPAINPTVEPRLRGPTQVLFTFNKDMTAADGVLDTSEFTLTNATYVSATIVSSNLTLNLTNVVDQSKVTVVLNGMSDLAGNALVGTNAVCVRALFGDANQSGTINIADMQAIKFKLSPALTATNFLCDLNLSGAINIADMQVAKSLLSHTVPLGSFNLNTPTFSLPAATLGEALGAPELVWSTDGDDEWTPTMAPDGSSAAWSGSIGNLNVSWVETTVEGPGTVSFEWKVSSEADADFLTFSVDGVDQPGRISGEVDWQSVAFTIPSGTHRLTWTYAKNRANACGLDAGWLRRVIWQPSP